MLGNPPPLEHHDSNSSKSQNAGWFSSITNNGRIAPELNQFKDFYQSNISVDEDSNNNNNNNDGSTKQTEGLAIVKTLPKKKSSIFSKSIENSPPLKHQQSPSLSESLVSKSSALRKISHSSMKIPDRGNSFGSITGSLDHQCGSLTLLLKERVNQDGMNDLLVGSLPTTSWNKISHDGGYSYDGFEKLSDCQKMVYSKSLKHNCSSPKFRDHILADQPPEVTVEKSLVELDRMKRQILSSRNHEFPMQAPKMVPQVTPIQPVASAVSNEPEIFEMESDREVPESKWEKISQYMFSQPFTQNWFFKNSESMETVDGSISPKRMTEESDNPQMAFSCPSHESPEGRPALGRTRTYPHKLADLNVWFPQNL